MQPAPSAEPLDGECLVLCGFAPSLLMLRGGQPLDIERLRRPVDAARLALRAHIERARITVLGVRAAASTRHRRRAGRFLYGPAWHPTQRDHRPRRPAALLTQTARRSLLKWLKKPSSKKPAPAPVDPKKAPPAKRPTGPIWEKKPKNFAIGGDIQVRGSSAPGKSSRASAVFSTRLASLALAPSSALSSCSRPRRHHLLNPILSLTLVPPPFIFILSQPTVDSAATSSGRSTCASSGSARSCTSG